MKRYPLFLLFLIFNVSFSFTVFSQVSDAKKIEIPAIDKGDVIIYHKGYSLSYKESHEQAEWVAYMLCKTRLNSVAKRSNRFIVDPKVKTGTAADSDYSKSGYDRGHLAPAADMGWSAITMNESFYYSNMSPQLPGFNRGIWKKLEEKLRNWAAIYDTLYIATGPILDKTFPTIGTNKVSIPEYYYKVIVDLKGKKGIGFIIPNKSSSLPLTKFAVSIDSVEAATSIDFFPKIENALENKIEQKICLPCWIW